MTAEQLAGRATCRGVGDVSRVFEVAAERSGLGVVGGAGAAHPGVKCVAVAREAADPGVEPCPHLGQLGSQMVIHTTTPGVVTVVHTAADQLSNRRCRQARVEQDTDLSDARLVGLVIDAPVVIVARRQQQPCSS